MPLNIEDLARQLAAAINESRTNGTINYVFLMMEKTFKVLSAQETGEGACLIRFEFEGMVNTQDEPMTYLASGSVQVGPDGRIREDTISF